jgi:arylsulfatase A-like enzyme/Tfp pilus assembly protein PilF
VIGRSRTLALAGVVAALAAGAGVWQWRLRSVGPVAPARPNVVLITLDTTRADRIGAYGYRRGRTPRLDRLASEGVLFERALTAAPTTLPAHTSLLTGRFPFGHGVRNNGTPLGEQPATLASAFHDRGYATAAFVSAFVLDRRFGLGRGFDEYDDRLDAAPGVAAELVERRGDRTAAAASAWIAAHASAPFFVWIHLYDPHDPYEPPAPYRGMFPGQPYDDEVAFTDGVVGSVVDALERQGELPSTVVAVIGDHGESLGEHGEATHGMFVYESAMHVPLLLWGPPYLPAGRRLAPPVRSVDVASTLLELAGLPALPDIDGQSLLPLVRGGSQPSALLYGETYFPLLFMNWSPLRMVRDDRWKYIEAPEPELYDLDADPGEQVNLAAREAARTRGFQRALDAIAARHPVAGPGATVSRETARKLESLGYVGLATALPNAAGELRPDPKKMIEVFNRLREANSAVLQGRWEAAASVARSVLAADAGNAFAMLVLAKAEMGQEQYRSAAQHLRGYLSQVPTSADAHHWLSICHLQLGDDAAALRETEAALAIDPRFGDARELRGGLLAVLGRTDDALSELRAAVELNPEKAAFRVALGRELFRSGRPDEADAQFSRAAELDPGNPDAHGGHGACLAALGRLDQAVTAFARALELQPDRVEVRLDYARALEQLGRRDAASAEYTTIAQSATASPPVRAAAREGLSRTRK